MPGKGNSHVFEAPVAPGDPLWWCNTRVSGGPGPELISADKAEGAVEAVLFGRGGGYRIMTDNGSTDEPGGEYSCLDEASCLDWIRKNKPGAVLLDGRAVTAAVTHHGGDAALVSLEATMDGIEDLFGSCALATGEPDAAGHFPVYLKNANKENTSIQTFIRDRAGNPVDVIYGMYLLLRFEDGPDGIRRLADISEEVAACINEKKDAGAGCPETVQPYDPAFWTEADGMTVGQLKSFLEKFPGDAVLHCCGTSHVWWHWCPGTKALSLDCEELAELPEYQDRQPALLKGPEG